MVTTAEEMIRKVRELSILFTFAETA
jgi:hypothetical protein